MRFPTKTQLQVRVPSICRRKTKNGGSWLSPLGKKLGDPSFRISEAGRHEGRDHVTTVSDEMDEPRTRKESGDRVKMPEMNWRLLDPDGPSCKRRSPVDHDAHCPGVPAYAQPPSRDLGSLYTESGCQLVEHASRRPWRNQGPQRTLVESPSDLLKVVTLREGKHLRMLGQHGLQQGRSGSRTAHKKISLHRHEAYPFSPTLPSARSVI